MEAIQQEHMHQIASLFEGWNETMIWSCLQGYMGRAWADCAARPSSAQIVVGDFCVLAGEPNRELAGHIPLDHPTDCLLMIPQTEEWAKLIEACHPNSERFLRYAIHKDRDAFDRQKLQGFVEQIPTGYRLEMIDEHLYHLAKTQEWSRDLCSQFPTYAQYAAQGIGVMALLGDLPVSGASSYTVYQGGIEIEVDTQEQHRQRGLALACAAKLILTCLDRGLYPSWDAHDLRSVALAEKLGYQMEKPYVAYCVPTGHSIGK